MKIVKSIFKELVKRGYSLAGPDGEKRVWNLSDSKLWYLTPELSQGFLNLGKYYEPYRMKVVDTENELLEKHTGELLSLFATKKFNLIDLGCGDGTKAATFIASLPEDVTVRYCPVDISEYFIQKATERINGLEKQNVSEIKPFVSDFVDLGNVMETLKSSNGYEKNIIFFLGETVSHYEVNEILYDIESNLNKGDITVIGNGYKVNERFIEVDKYKDKLFDKWFIFIMQGLGFSPDEVRYDARFNNGRLEFYYEILTDKSIELEGKTIQFKKGEEIIVGCQYKYYQEEWEDFFKFYFSKIHIIRNEKKEYAFYICEK